MHASKRAKSKSHVEDDWPRNIFCYKILKQSVITCSTSRCVVCWMCMHDSALCASFIPREQRRKTQSWIFFLSGVPLTEILLPRIISQSWRTIIPVSEPNYVQSWQGDENSFIPIPQMRIRSSTTRERKKKKKERGRRMRANERERNLTEGRGGMVGSSHAMSLSQTDPFAYASAYSIQHPRVMKSS